MTKGKTSTATASKVSDLQNIASMVFEEAEPAQADRSAEVRMPVGQVVSVNGAQVLIMVDLKRDTAQEYMPRVGSMICIESSTADIIAGVSGLSAPTPGLDSDESQMLVAELELIGEIRDSPESGKIFRKGISVFPSLGDVAAAMTSADQAIVYDVYAGSRMRIGHVSDAGGVPAHLDPDALLKGNFALFGTAGAGVSAAAAVLMRSLVKSRHPTRIILVDPHDEYGRSFGRAANIMKISKGMIAHWMLSFRELVYLLSTQNGPLSKPEIEVLAEAVCAARKRFIQSNPTEASMRAATDGLRISVETPIPYRLADVTGFLDRAAQVDSQNSGSIYKQLSARLESAGRNRQFKAIFGNVATQDTLATFLSELFRIPVGGKPITVIQLEGLEPVVGELIVSMMARYARLISESQKGVIQFLLVIEDAHRFLPAEGEDAPVALRSLQEILDNGTKLPLTIGLLTNRLRALSVDALEHCQTMLAMRLPGQADQDRFLEIAPERASGLLESVRVMDVAECLALGPAAPVPMRVSFTRLPADAVPSEHAPVQEASDGDLPPAVANLGLPYLENLVDLWRYDTS